MTKVIIVDDDAKCIQRLCDDLLSFPEMEVIATFNSPEEALNNIVREQPDMLFLDVEMPEMTGIELLKRLQPRLRPDIKVVFYTAFDKYLKEALRASAFDYLQKPYMFDELKTIMDRFRMETPKNTDNFDQSLHKLLRQDKNTFAIQGFSGLMLVNSEKILLFQYFNDLRCWQMMLTDDPNKYHKLRTTTKADELLAISKEFVQISQECIVNRNYVLSIENGTLRCLFCPPYDGIERVVTRLYFKKMRDMLDII